MSLESYVERFRKLKDVPLKRLSFDEMCEMDDDYMEYASFAAYLLSRDSLPPATRTDDLSDDELREWLTDIVTRFLSNREVNVHG